MATLRRRPLRPTDRPTDPPRAGIATIFFCANLTGVVCARSLHPQFYAWFAHQLVWLCFGTGCAFEPMHWCARPSPPFCSDSARAAEKIPLETWETDPGPPLDSLVLISLVEYGFSVWPSTVNSSLGLVLSLVILLFGVYYGTPPGPGREDEVVVPAEWDRVGAPSLRKTQ